MAPALPRLKTDTENENLHSGIETFMRRRLLVSYIKHNAKRSRDLPKDELLRFPEIKDSVIADKLSNTSVLTINDQFEKGVARTVTANRGNKLNIPNVKLKNAIQSRGNVKDRPTEWDPVIQASRNDLAYNMYMLRRRQRHVTHDMKDHRLDIDTTASNMGYKFKPHRMRNSMTQTGEQSRGARDVRKKVTSSLPSVKTKVPLAATTWNFMDNFPMYFTFDHQLPH